MKTKLTSALLAVVIAFGLWLYVITTISPNSTETYYNIPVVLEGESVLNNDRGLMLTAASSSTVTLELAGTRRDLIKVNSSNITVKVDLSKIYDPGKHSLKLNVSYPGDVSNNAFEILSQSDFYVNVEERRNKNVPVKVVWSGTRSEDYLYDTENAVLDCTAVNIIGPASVADQIDHAVVEVDLTDRTESLSETYRYTLCNAEGNPVDAAEIVTNVEQIRVDMKIQRIKTVSLVVEILYGGGATSGNTSIALSPASIRVSGSDAALSEVGDTLTVATIDLSAIERSSELIYPITLPEGVTNQTGVTEATVKIAFSGMSIREFTIEDIRTQNVPEGLYAEIINASLPIKVRGSASEISRLTAEDIYAVVDFANAVEGSATYKATVVFPEGFKNVGTISGPYSVSATVQSEEE